MIISIKEFTNSKYVDDINYELENYQNYNKLETTEELKQVNLSTANENEIIKRLDSNPKTVVESGK